MTWATPPWYDIPCPERAGGCQGARAGGAAASTRVPVLANIKGRSEVLHKRSLIVSATPGFLLSSLVAAAPVRAESKSKQGDQIPCEEFLAMKPVGFGVPYGGADPRAEECTFIRRKR